MPVPFINLHAVNDHLLEDYQAELARIFESGQFIGGPAVQRFEEQFAKYVGCKFGVGVNSGTDALLLSLNALGVGPGDEVLCPAFTFGRCGDVIARLGATPVIVDVRPETWCIDPDQALASMTQRTKAVVVIHLFGLAAEIERITQIARTYSVYVLEDMRHAAGARLGGRRLGSFGQFGCFSYYPTRTLGAAGDAGLITTSDEKGADAVRRLREHGRATSGEHDLIGYNSRLDTTQAALLSLKLSELEENNWERVENARLYTQLFKGSPVQTPVFRDDLSHVYNMYTILAPDRDKLAARLTEKGIGHEIYYRTPLHMQPALSYLGYKEGAFPVSEDLSRRAISLPVAPGLKKSQIHEVANTVLSFYGVKAS
jgi:dTDP-4-amino-4,6-dideoxygalactose transaminase